MRPALPTAVLLLATALQPPTLAAQSATLPPTADPVLHLPAPNACASLYDAFYQTEPGVYAYWPLCEPRRQDIGYDYLGRWPLNHGFQPEAALDPTAGPVPDNETAARAPAVRAPAAQPKLEQQGIFLNKHAGTLALWIDADATSTPIAAESFRALAGRSSVAITVSRAATLCFSAELTNALGQPARATACGYPPNTWHRVVLTWTAATLTLYVDGAPKASQPLNNALDDDIFYYQLFPGCCHTGKPIALAKALLANRAWTAQQAAADFTPALIQPPSGGVAVLPERLGTIHRDVLGYVDNNQDISSPARVSALLTGLRAAGVTSVRYMGAGPADAEDWRGGASQCTTQPGRKTPARNRPTANNLDRYTTLVARPLHLHMDFVVNYGSNPPACDRGGDPIANAADLVRYANLQHRAPIARWEIGNEQYAYGGGPLIDLHPNPYLTTNGAAPSTYTAYEPAFYDAMKAVDPRIAIAVPSTGPDAGYNALVHYQIPLLAHAKFDALLLHAYPITDPITDGATLYPDRVASGTQLRGTLLSLQTQLLNAGKPPDALWVTEWNAEPAGNRWSTQTIGAAMPLFAAIQLAEFMQAGVPFAAWQAQGETAVCSAFNVDPAAAGVYSWFNGCGDTALVDTGPIANAGEVPIGLHPGDLLPAARAFQLLSQSGFVTEGESMLRVQTDLQRAPWLLAYAATHGHSYAVLLINRDRDTAHTVPVHLPTPTPGPITGPVTQWTYGRAQYDGSRTGKWSAQPTSSTLPPGTSAATLPPWSITVLCFSCQPPKPSKIPSNPSKQSR